MKTFLKVFWFGAGILFAPLGAVIITSFDWYGSLDSYTLSVFFGAMAYFYFMVTLLLSNRLRVLDRLFGHDRVIIYHRTIAWAGIATGVVHRFLKIEVFGPPRNLQMNLGVVVLLGTFILVGFSLIFMITTVFHRIKPLGALRKWFQTKLVDYHGIKQIHSLMAVLVLVLVVHVFMASTLNPEFYTLRFILMAVPGLVAIGFTLYRRGIKPHLLAESAYIVDSVEHLGSVTHLELTPQGKKLDFKGGQYAYFTPLASPVPAHEHPFTISRAPNSEGRLSVSAKALGNFTSQLADLTPGTKVAVDGPYGALTWQRASQSGPVLLIAGGIGITPFRAMVQERFSGSGSQGAAPIHLLWGGQHTEDLVFDREFAQFARENNSFAYTAFLANQDPQADHHRRGFIDARGILSHFESNGGASTVATSPLTVFYCGPSPMREPVRRALKESGIMVRAFIEEKFSFG